jgi:hypothetical protein
VPGDLILIFFAWDGLCGSLLFKILTIYFFTIKCLYTEHKYLRKRREIFQRIIDIVKFIGKPGLSYGGDKLEAVYSLENMSIDHRNFLELVVIVSKYDIM